MRKLESCTSIQVDLAAYASGARIESVQTHLASCSHCREILENLRAAAELQRTAAASLDTARRPLHLDKWFTKQLSIPSLHWKPILAGAAAVLALIGAIFIARSPRTVPPSPPLLSETAGASGSLPDSSPSSPTLLSMHHQVMSSSETLSLPERNPGFQTSHFRLKDAYLDSPN